MNDTQPQFTDRDLLSCFDDISTIACEILPFNHDRELRVLDIGGSPGIFGPLVSKNFPNGRFNLIESDSRRLDRARTGYNDSGDISSRIMVPGSEPLGGTYDLIFSALSLNTLEPHLRGKLVSEIFNCLEPGGFFVHCDVMRGGNPLADKIFRRTLRSQLEKTPPEGLDGDEMQGSHAVSLSIHCRLLEMAGFSEVTVWYQNLSLALVSGSRPLI